MSDETPSAKYSIGEVSERVDQEPHVLRYWEQEFDALSPEKDRAGRRVYTDADVATIRRICYLLKEERYTIEGARRAMARADAEQRRHDAIRDDLKEMRAFLQAVLERL
jgi:DNA-binding transcriptional MerR regulator